MAPWASVVILATARPSRHFWATWVNSRSCAFASDTADLASSGEAISAPTSTVRPVSAAT